MTSNYADLLCLGIGAGISLGLITYILKEKEIISLLKDVPEVEISSSLAADVASSSNGIAACLWGPIKAIGPPLKCLNRPEVNGVVRQHTIKEYIVSESPVSGYWLYDQRILNKTVESIPFSIQENDIGFQVMTPSILQYFDLKVVSMDFEAAPNSFASHFWGLIRGVRQTGTEQTEKMLIEGTRVMGIGKLVSQNGTFSLIPCPPFPYIVTTRSKQMVIEEMQKSLNIPKIFCFIALFGMSCFAYRIIKWIYKKYKESIYKRREAELIETARVNMEVFSDVPDNYMCVICLSLRDVIFLPCRHVCLCRECTTREDILTCPFCRAPIEDIAPIFYS